MKSHYSIKYNIAWLQKLKLRTRPRVTRNKNKRKRNTNRRKYKKNKNVIIRPTKKNREQNGMLWLFNSISSQDNIRKN